MSLVRRLLLFSASLLLPLSPSSAQSAASSSHTSFRRTAEAAYQRQDFAAARDAYAAALALRPDSPRYLHHLAATQALTDRSDDALATLQRLTALGVAPAVERDSAFASLQGSRAFNAIRTALAANREPQGSADLLVELPGRIGIIEGIAFRDRTGDLFLGDVHQRCIWRRDRDGRVTRYSAEDEELFGVFGLALDETRQTLWAATSAVPEMSGFTPEQKGRAALAAFSLVTGELLRVIDVPSDGRDHVLGDLIVAPDGTIYATDSTAPIIWRYLPGGEEMDKLVEYPDFVSLQGLVLTNRTLIAADFANGLFAIDLSESAPVVRAFTPPPNATLVGLDGLAPAPDGLFAVQNGVSPQRLIRVGLSSDLTALTSVTVLAAAFPHLDDLALVTLVNGRPTFIANAGWENFDAAKSAHPTAHSVRIFQTTPP